MKVAIRELRLSDLNDFRACINDKEVVKRLDDDGIKHPFTLAAARKYITKSLKNKDTHEFAILIDGKFAGTVVLENPAPGKKTYELGYVVCKKLWGKGIATKAVRLMIDYGFKKMKINKIWAGGLSNNPASKRILEKCGFKLEGRLRKHTYKNKKYYDDHIYGLLRR